MTLLALFVLSQTLIIVTLDKTGADVGKLQTVCLRHPFDERASGVKAREILAKWKPQDISNFRRHFFLDLWLHPLLYALFFTSAILYMLAKLKQQRQKQKQQQPDDLKILLYGRIGTLLTFSAASFDVLENLKHSSILALDEDDEPQLLLAAASDLTMYEACIFSCAKWFIMGGITIWLIWMYKWIHASSKETKKE